MEAMTTLSPTTATGIEFTPDGEVIVGPEFGAVEAAWRVGVAAMARAGARIILDEVLLGGAEGQERWDSALLGLSVLWVGVRCDSATASAREGHLCFAPPGGCPRGRTPWESPLADRRCA